MINELQKIKELSEKYATGNYICVVDNRFGPKGYFIKEDNEFKLNWNYTLIHNKHEEVLKAFLEDEFIDIYMNGYSINDIISKSKFIESYNEEDDYSILFRD